VTTAFQSDAFQADSFQIDAGAAIEVFASQPHYGEAFWPEAETEDYQADSSLDVVAMLFPPAPPLAIEFFAAQPHYGDQFETYIAEETQDYQADSTLETLPVCDFNIYSDVYGDCVPVLTDAMLIAAQPSFADDLATYVSIETQDYVGAPEQLEFLAPPEIRIPELIPALELREQAWFGDQETEDYGPDATVEVPQLYPATALEPIETFASQPLAEQWYFPADEIEDYLAAPEQLEFLAPPEVPISELLAAQPHFGESAIPAEETEDYANDVALDVTSTFFPLALEPVETFAAQALSEQPWFADVELEDYQAPAEQLEFLAPPEVPTDELLAAQPHYGEWFWEAEETQDYAAPPEQLEFLAPAGTETVLASQPELGIYFWSAEETEDYQNEAVLDISAQMFPPPLNPGLPVEDPQAVLVGIEGLASEVGTEGKAVLVGVEGTAR
jgi:hypothetical protein